MTGLSFSFSPEEGLFSKRNIGQICLSIQLCIFFVVLFCLLLHCLALRISLPLYIFYELLLYWSRPTTGRSGSTQRFVAVDLPIFYISKSLWHPGCMKWILAQEVGARSRGERVCFSLTRPFARPILSCFHVLFTRLLCWVENISPSFPTLSR